MMLQTFGILSLLAAVAAFIMHMRTSYETQGGGLGQDPCVAAAVIQVPLLTMLGLATLSKATRQFNFIWWQWFLIWGVETVVVAASAIWIGELARRRAKASSKRPPRTE